VGQISNTTIQNNGVVEFNGSSAFEFDSIVSGIGNLKHSGSGILTISGDNTFTGSLNITDKEVLLTHTKALGTGNSIISNSGTLSVGSDITLPSLTTTGGINVKTNVTTIGAQIYNGDVNIVSDDTLEIIDYDNFTQTGENGEITKTTVSFGDDGYVSKDWKIFTTDNADISFSGKLKASSGSKDNKTSLKLQTCTTEACTAGEVTFNDKVGFEFIDKDMAATTDERNSYGIYSNLTGYNQDNFYRLDVNSKTTNINTDIMTWEEQIYRSPVLVGSNDDSLIKYAISIDPAVTFLSTVGDSGDDGTHTLVVRAIKLPSGLVDPAINFDIDKIGNLAKFDPYALSLINDDALSFNFGDFGSLGSFSGSVAGYSQARGVRDNAYIVSYSAPSISPVVSNSSSSSSLVDIIKSLMEEGNNGSILDFFKNLGSTRGQNRTYVKSIEILSGSEIQSQGRNTESAPADQCVATAEVNFEINKEDC
jgi:autotransporter-associated beta strand protein